ncbi:MAG: CADD family putative folate metabolism protein, partial [Candidatus Limnocylindria bacterium]
MDLIDQIDALIRDRHLLTHPFYTRWREGTLPVGAIQEYTRQYYAFEAAFPRLLSAIHSRTDDAVVRQSILDNLWDEEHGTANHAELWLRFAEGVGVQRDEVREATPNAGTQGLMDAYWDLARNGSPAAAIAALYAYEAQVPEVAAEKITGLRDRYGIDDARTLAFFTVHSTLDLEHSEAERDAIRRTTATDGESDAAREATSRALDAWWGFLDAVN